MIFEKKTSEKLGETFFKGAHSSGLEIVVVPKKQATLYALFATRYGSIDNSFRTRGETEFHDVPAGVAHFLEHKLFENSNGEDTFLRFSNLGASANAFTSNDVTAYLFTSTENYYESLEELITFVSDPYFTEATVEKEMGIIEQELRMYEDNPHRALYENMLTCLYENHPVRISVGGTVESIHDITPEILYNCYNTFYNPCNMMLIVSGDVEPDRVAEIVDKALPRREKVFVEKAEYSERSDVFEKYVEKEFPVSLPLFCIGVKDPDLSNDPHETVKREMEHTLLLELLFGRGSEFYENLYSSGLINHKFDASYQVSRTFSHTVISGESRDPRAVFEAVEKELSSYRSGEKKIDRCDFDRVQALVWGMCVQVWNSTTDIGDAFLDYELLGTDPTQIPEVLSEITPDRLLARLEKSYAPSQTCLSVVVPKGDAK